MADEIASSPLSSPPESVVNVAIDSPVKKETEILSSESHAESSNGVVEVATTLPTAIVDAPGEEVKPPAPDDSDEGAQPSSQKRKAGAPRISTAAKKPRRVAVPKQTAQDKKWEAPFVYTNPQSGLAKADLRVRAPVSSPFDRVL